MITLILHTKLTLTLKKGHTQLSYTLQKRQFLHSKANKAPKPLPKSIQTKIKNQQGINTFSQNKAHVGQTSKVTHSNQPLNINTPYDKRSQTTVPKQTCKIKMKPSLKQKRQKFQGQIHPKVNLKCKTYRLNISSEHMQLTHPTQKK